VAGLAAYLRGLPSKWQDQLKKPRLVKKLISHLERQLNIDNPDLASYYNSKKPKLPWTPSVWNGVLGLRNCLLDDSKSTYTTPDKKVLKCPDIPDDLDKIVIGDPVDACKLTGRGLGGECGRDSGEGDAITYRSGPPSPTPCSANCGSLCTGYWCSPDPFGTRPGFLDPNNPANKPASPVPVPIPSGGSGGGGAGCPQSAVSQCSNNGSQTPAPTVGGSSSPMPTSNPGDSGNGSGNGNNGSNKPTSSPTTSPKPSQSPGNKVTRIVYIRLREWQQSIPSDSGTPTTNSWVHQYEVYEGPFDYKDMCNKKPLYFQNTGVTTENHILPSDRIGPFNVFGRTGCVYTGGTDKTIGDMTCPGINVIAISCVAESPYTYVCGATNIQDTWATKVVCSWTE
jgi:hypothetical protein